MPVFEARHNAGSLGVFQRIRHRFLPDAEQVPFNRGKQAGGLTGNEQLQLDSLPDFGDAKFTGAPNVGRPNIVVSSGNVTGIKQD
ncbi:MAG: hypothetical protein M3Y57_13800 [Acidobacteriota bacterium]|nr:hypothetical protein [Acidobacteriota bacterium]